MGRQRKGGGMTNRSDRDATPGRKSTATPDRRRQGTSSRPVTVDPHQGMSSRSSLFMTSTYTSSYKARQQNQHNQQGMRPSSSAPMLNSDSMRRARSKSSQSFADSFRSTQPALGTVHRVPKPIVPTWTSITKKPNVRPDGGYGYAVDDTIVSEDTPSFFQIKQVMHPEETGSWKYVTRPLPAPKITPANMDDTCVSPSAPEWFHLRACKEMGHGMRPLVVPNATPYVKGRDEKQYFIMDGADIESNVGRKRF